MATMENQIKVGIVGCAGRMGQMLVTQVNATDGCVIAGATEHTGHTAIGQDAGTLAGLGPLGVIVGDDAAHMIAAVDAVSRYRKQRWSMRGSRLRLVLRSLLAQQVLVMSKVRSWRAPPGMCRSFGRPI